jgi:hypothetical protein
VAYATFDYQYNSVGVEPPTGNQIRSNSAALSTSTLLWIRDSENSGLDASPIWHHVRIDDEIAVQDFDDSTRGVTFKVRGLPVVKVDYTEVPVTPTGIGPAGEPPAQKVRIILLREDAELPPGGLPGDVRVKTSTDDYAVAWVTPGGNVVPSPMVAGCEEWPITWACDTGDAAPELLVAAEDAARSILWAYGGRNIGRCTYTEGYYPPCAQCPGAPYKTASGQWRNGGGAHDCCRILLVRQPVASIEAVTVSGELLDPASYATDGAWLRRNGECWPCGDDCSEPPMVVTYTAGRPLPAFTASAMGEVACEVLYGLQGAACKLPSRAVTVTRQGVTVQLAAADDLASKNRLGLPIADAWLAIVNPGGLQQASRVYSPDLARRGS